MKFLKNRTVLGVVCIALALIICFAITPLFNASKSSTMKIVRIKNDLKIGQEITSKDIALVYRGTAENAQKFISAQEKLLEELSQKDDEKENNSKPEVPQNTSESEIAENNTSEDNSRENNSEIDKVIIDPEDNSQNISDNSDSDPETEVTSDAESV